MHEMYDIADLSRPMTKVKKGDGSHSLAYLKLSYPLAYVVVLLYESILLNRHWLLISFSKLSDLRTS